VDRKISYMLLTDSDVLNFDERRLCLIYEEWPRYFKDAAEICFKLDHKPDFYKSIVLCGMGGSATACDILHDLIYSSSTIPVTVVRGGRMPHNVNKHSLVIANSVSGNTRETILNLEEATARNAEVICISSGGKLKQEAERLGHKHITIPNLALPRVSLPFLVMPCLRSIEPLLKQSLEEEILLIHDNLARILNSISVTVPTESNPAKKIASFLDDSTAFCFTSPDLISAGTRFKNSLNENAKVHCVRESILEASHNEIVPFTFNDGNSPSKVLLLRWEQDCSLVDERFNQVKAFFNEIGQPVMELISSDKSLINAIMSSIYILDYSTIYMAISRNVDPSPTPAIDILKKMYF
jgi:glucose/mannose-6-phosphate isomerase